MTHGPASRGTTAAGHGRTLRRRERNRLEQAGEVGRCPGVLTQLKQWLVPTYPEPRGARTVQTCGASALPSASTWTHLPKGGGQAGRTYCTPVSPLTAEVHRQALGTPSAPPAATGPARVTGCSQRPLVPKLWGQEGLPMCGREPEAGRRWRSPGRASVSCPPPQVVTASEQHRAGCPAHSGGAQSPWVCTAPHSMQRDRRPQMKEQAHGRCQPCRATLRAET